MYMLYEPEAAANSLIRGARTMDLSINGLILQKLMYFAHGWHLAILRMPLINEVFEVRDFGVVLPSIFLSVRQNGLNPINSPFQKFDTQAGKWRSPMIKEATFAADLLQRILKVYGSCQTSQLINMTQNDGSPWQQCIHAQKATIDNELLTTYFASYVVNNTDEDNTSFFNIQPKHVKIYKEEDIQPNSITLKELAMYTSFSKNLILSRPKNKWKEIRNHKFGWAPNRNCGTLHLKLEDEVDYTLDIPTPRELKAVRNIFRFEKKVKFNIISGTIASDWTHISNLPKKNDA